MVKEAFSLMQIFLPLSKQEGASINKEKKSLQYVFGFCVYEKLKDVLFVGS